MAQKLLLNALIAEYIDNVPAKLADQRRSRLKEANGEVWLACAGVE